MPPDKIQYLCSCPDYLSGTSKNSKKKSTCKKCKGIKLPFAPIGGTVRMISSSQMHQPISGYHKFAATVRLPSCNNSSSSTSTAAATTRFKTNHRRPTILCGDRDPYDLLRQSRLYNEPVMQRNFSELPTYHRTFLPNGATSQPNFIYEIDARPLIYADGYRTHPLPQSNTIPYELISTTLHNNEFSPMYDLPMRNGIRDVLSWPSTATDSDASTKTESNRSSLIDDMAQTHQKSILKHPLNVAKSRLSAPAEVLRYTKMTQPKCVEAKESNNITKRTNQLTNKLPKSVDIRVNGTNTNALESSMTNCRSKKVQFTESEKPKSENNVTNGTEDSKYGAFDRSRRRGNLRRSMSDRRLPDNKKDEINFKDTTAIRAKPIRPCPQQLFQRYLSPMRPLSPPPQLPPARSSSVPVRPPRQQRKGKRLSTDSSSTAAPINEADEISVSRIFGLLPVSTLSKSSTRPTAAQTKSLDRKLFKNCDTATLQKTLIAVNSEECSSTVIVKDKMPTYRSSVTIAADEFSDKVKQIENSESKVKKMNGRNDAKNGVFVIKTFGENANNNSATEIKIVYNEKDVVTSPVTPPTTPKVTTNNRKSTTLICLNENSDAANNSIGNQLTTKEICSIEKSTNEVNALKSFGDGFILKLLTDPQLSLLMEGLEIKQIAEIMEKALARVKNAHNAKQNEQAKDETEFDAIIKSSLYSIIKEERVHYECRTIENRIKTRPRAKSPQSSSFENSDKNESDAIPLRKLCEMLSGSQVWKSSTSSIDHQYESISTNCDPIYEEINDVPPPLPVNPPPSLDELNAKHHKPMFLGASKYDILSYLVDAKERGVVPDESYSFKFIRPEKDESLKKPTNAIDMSKVITIIRDPSSYSSGSDDIPVKLSNSTGMNGSSGHSSYRKCMTHVERNDSGVGSETSKISRNKYHRAPRLSSSLNAIEHKNNVPPIHLCEDCDDPVEAQLIEETAVMFDTIICRKCKKKRAERREILAEFFETEEKYSRDLQIIIDEFYQPMLVAGLLTQEQLSAVFLNIEDLLENSQVFCEKLREAFYSALEQNDDDLLTVDIGKIILKMTLMMNAFEIYCIQQAAASLLLANLEKEKELLRIFLRVSQMENTVLRRMNLNSFLMVPVQRVTKYPLLLSRLYKFTPAHLESRERLKDAQQMIESYLNRMNREAKDISTKLWRRLASNPSMHATRDSDMPNIKLRKTVIDLLEWNHEKVYFIVEGKLLVTQPTDNNWRKGRTIKLTPVNALLVTNEMNGSMKQTTDNTQMNFTKPQSNRETVLLLVREKSGRYTLFRDPFYLDRCVICTESDWAEYFEVHEITTKDSFIFKAEDDSRTKHWYSQLQHCAQGTGAWRKRRTALANIMINGMMHRS